MIGIPSGKGSAVAIGAMAVLALASLPALSGEMQKSPGTGKQIMENASVDTIIEQLSRTRKTHKTRGLQIIGSPSMDGKAVKIVAAPPPSAPPAGGCFVGDMRSGTRGLKVLPGATLTAPPARECHPGYVSLIHFAYASARILPQSAKELDKVAQALQSSKLSKDSFLIAGHTDATGSDAYNLVLSQQRAEAVVSYLESHGVKVARLRPEGRGETELLDKSNPASPVNRRVEIINVSR